MNKNNYNQNRKMEYVVQVSELIKVYRSGDENLVVLNGLNLNVKENEIVAIVGKSGSGKSTLLHLIGGLDSPTGGSILVKNTNIEKASEEELSEFRNRHIGFIFQFHHLLSEFSVMENIMIPFLIKKFDLNKARVMATHLLKIMEIYDKRNSLPSSLSGGESQRAAIARALINKPDIILADEPTGNLDPQTAERVKSLLFEVVRELGNTMIIVTHNKAIVDKADKVFLLINGKLKSLA